MALGVLLQSKNKLLASYLELLGGIFEDTITAAQKFKIIIMEVRWSGVSVQNRKLPDGTHW